MFRFGPFGINVPSARALRARHERARDDVEDAVGLGRGARRADDGPEHRTRRRHPAHPPAGRRRRRAHARPHRRVRRTVASRSSWSASPCSTTAGSRRRGRSSTTTGHIADATGADATMRLHTDLRVGIEGGRVRGRHVLEAGDRAVLRAVVGRRTSPRRPTSTTPRADRRDRDASGGAGSDRARIPDHRYRDPIQRSALAIKGLTYMPTGATVAALDHRPAGDTRRRAQLGLPLQLDARLDLHPAGVALAQPRLGSRRVHAVRRRPRGERRRRLQIMYGIDGRRDLTESTLDHLSGYDGARPGADRQRRLRPAPERRVRRRARLDPAAHSPAQPAAAAPAVADRAGAGRCARRTCGASPTRASGRRAASRSTTCRPS